MLDDEELHGWMMRYQDRYGVPPVLAEMTETFPSLNHRSSAYYAIHRLIAQGKVTIIGEPTTRRRYKAL